MSRTNDIQAYAAPFPKSYIIDATIKARTTEEANYPLNTTEHVKNQSTLLVQCAYANH